MNSSMMVLSFTYIYIALPATSSAVSTAAVAAAAVVTEHIISKMVNGNNIEAIYRYYEWYVYVALTHSAYLNTSKKV